MAAFQISREIETTCYSVALSLGYISLKEEQREVITIFVAGTNAIRRHFKFSLVTTQELKFNCILIIQMRDARHTRPFYFSEAHKRVGCARLPGTPVYRNVKFLLQLLPWMIIYTIILYR